MSSSARPSHIVLFAGGSAFLHGLAFAVVVGYLGSSRAVSTGIETLWQEHLGGLALAAGAATVGALLARLKSATELALGLGLLVILDVAFAGAVVAVVGELTVTHIPLVAAVSTGLGTQVVAAAVGGWMTVAAASRE